MSVPNLPQNPCPQLDERAVEAAARQRFHEAMRGDKDWTWASVTEDTREAYREAERRARAAYFAAVDREVLVERVARALYDTENEGGIKPPGGVSMWPPVDMDEADEYRLTSRAALAALGLFTPDTEESDVSEERNVICESCGEIIETEPIPAGDDAADRLIPPDDCVLCAEPPEQER